MSKFLCMEIGRSIVRVAEVKKSGKHVTVLKVSVFETQEDLTKDGKVRISEQVITEIKEGLDKAELAADEIYFVVDSTRILYKTVEIPVVANREISGTLQLSFSDMFPVDESLYHLSYLNKGQIKKGEQKMLQLEVWAVPNDLSESYYQLAVALGMSPKGLADATHSVATLLSDTFKNRNVATISIGEVSSAVSVLVDGSVVFSRSVPDGIDSAMKVLEKSSMTLDDIGNVGALELLYTQNVLLPQLPESLASSNEEEAIRYDATASLASLIASIQTALTQFLQKEEIQIQEVYLTGLGAGVAGIAKLFTFEFGAPVNVIRQDSKLTIPPSVSDEVLLLSCYTAIGSTIDKSNLFTKDERSGGDLVRKAKIDRMFAIGGLGILLLSGSFGLYSILSAIMARDNAKRQNTAYQENIATLQGMGVEQKYNEYQLSHSYNEEVKAIYEETKSGNEDMTKFLLELESIFPKSAVVTTLTINPTNCTMSVMCQDKYVASGVLHLMRNMETIKSMQCSAVGEDDEGNVVFTVTFELKSTAEREGKVDENGNPIEDNGEVGEGEAVEGGTVEGATESTNPTASNQAASEPTVEATQANQETTYAYATTKANAKDDVVLNKFKIGTVEYDSGNLKIDALTKNKINKINNSEVPPTISYANQVLVGVENGSVLQPDDSVGTKIVLGTLDDSTVYAINITSNENGSFTIPSLNISSGTKLTDATKALTAYTPVDLENGDKEYIIKNSKTTLTLTFGGDETDSKTGDRVLKLTSATIVNNALADKIM